MTTTTVTLDYQATLALYQYLSSTNAPAELVAPLEDALNRYELGDDYDDTDNEVLGLCEYDEDIVEFCDNDDTDVPSATMSTAELIESIQATADYAREFEQQWGIDDKDTVAIMQTNVQKLNEMVATALSKHQLL